MCHKPARLAGQQSYCMNCGWNRDAAIAAFRSSTRMAPIGIVIFGGLLFFMTSVLHFRNLAQIAIASVVPAIGISVNYFYARNRIAKLKALSQNTAARQSVLAGTPVTQPYKSSEPSAEATAEADAQYQSLLLVSRPRRIRMAKRGQLSIGVGLVVFLTFVTLLGTYLYGVWARNHSFGAFGWKDWMVLGLMALILLVPYGMWRSQMRERDLLENGEIAMGRVTRQWYDEGASSVAYEFKDFRGETHEGVDQDYTKKLYKGMAVPVFYDLNHPKH